MPRIRKKTSKRGTTNQRQKIKHKVSESRKKAKKEAKKTPQWKSKHKKDPGIPNNFPYKDQILAEVQEQRRKAEEEKQRHKDAKKAAKAAAASGSAADHEDDSDAEEQTEDVSSQAFDGVHTLSSSVSRSAKGKAPATAANEGDDDDEVPTLVDPTLPTLRAVLDKSNALVYVLDARDPAAFRSAHIEELAKEGGKKLLFVLNKIDTCPRESLLAWTQHLRTSTSAPVLLFRSASAFLPSSTPSTSSSSPYTSRMKEGTKKTSERADDAVGVDGVLSQFEDWSKDETGDEPFTVAVLGVTNSGKSSFINSLLGRAALPIYRTPSASAPPLGPSTTLRPSRISLSLSRSSSSSSTISLIDTPGLVPSPPSPDTTTPESRDALRVRDVLLRARGRLDRLKDPLPPVAHLVARADTQDLMVHYALPAFAPGDATAFLAALARASGLVRKGGALDHAGAARLVLRDWAAGKLPWYTLPPPPPPSASEEEKTKKAEGGGFTEDDEKVLEDAGVQSRRERRKSGGKGVVKMAPGSVDERKVAVDAPWDEDEDDENGSDEDEDVEMHVDDDADEEEADESSDEDEVDEEVDDEEDEEEEEEEAEDEDPPAGKRKRASQAVFPSRPTKKVAFAAPTKGRGPKASSKPSAPQLKSAPKSALKPPTKSLKAAKLAKPTATKRAPTKPTTTAPAPKSKPANATGKKKTSAVAPGEEAYDFGKFFR
ncbi:hypothetical protein PUNSTDRAFT_99645 [Punctularia strigosozonata HHB-11173 SS5]|uniref:uncharacterized protein n=1 Tax=Punctularia strigosozonata (strain HHB-11173) TaxID=741275 RepID=UPI0004418732|nr:uncharacterized protein PUNSTDRAFT_99645 [Punctularia strigosozonata HHB-11173 SS5]EIN10256.1 hypothetical protein PUNSTDRAFT_99645 [Punctularia strigosozonata HHB-11173 SS5]